MWTPAFSNTRPVQHRHRAAAARAARYGRCAARASSRRFRAPPARPRGTDRRPRSSRVSRAATIRSRSVANQAVASAFSAARSASGRRGRAVCYPASSCSGCPIPLRRRQSGRASAHARCARRDPVRRSAVRRSAGSGHRRSRRRHLLKVQGRRFCPKRVERSVRAPASAGRGSGPRPRLTSRALEAVAFGPS